MPHGIIQIPFLLTTDRCMCCPQRKWRTSPQKLAFHVLHRWQTRKQAVRFHCPPLSSPGEDLSRQASSVSSLTSLVNFSLTVPYVCTFSVSPTRPPAVETASAGPALSVWRSRTSSAPLATNKALMSFVISAFNRDCMILLSYALTRKLVVNGGVSWESWRNTWTPTPLPRSSLMDVCIRVCPVCTAMPLMLERRFSNIRVQSAASDRSAVSIVRIMNLPVMM